MNQNSWITPGIITSCKHKRELCKKLHNNNNNNNNNLGSHYSDYSKVPSIFLRKAKIIEHEKLILNSHNKVKTTWGIINKESGRNKKRSEIQTLNIEGRKITDQETVAETFLIIFLLSQKMLKYKVKIIL
jgi:hypothetical protein